MLVKESDEFVAQKMISTIIQSSNYFQTSEQISKLVLKARSMFLASGVLIINYNFVFFANKKKTIRRSLFIDCIIILSLNTLVLISLSVFSYF